MEGIKERLEREIDRDARVTTSGFVHEVMAASLGQLQRVSLAARCPDPVALFDEVDDIVRKFRNLHRRLNDARINRRGERDRHGSPPEQLPPAVRPFAYHGAYLGSFASVEAFAHACLDPSKPEEWAGYVDLTQAGIDLHLSGRYWTVDAGGVTHAFAVGRPPEPDEPEQADPDAVDSAASEHERPATRIWQRETGSLRGKPARRRMMLEPQVPGHAPERARDALRASGCDEAVISELLEHYVAHYNSLGDHAWFFLRRAGVSGWMLAHTDLGAMAEDWCEAGVLAWVADPSGGVHVFSLGDPLSSER